MSTQLASKTRFDLVRSNGESAADHLSKWIYDQTKDGSWVTKAELVRKLKSLLGYNKDQILTQGVFHNHLTRARWLMQSRYRRIMVKKDGESCWKFSSKQEHANDGVRRVNSLIKQTEKAADVLDTSDLGCIETAIRKQYSALQNPLFTLARRGQRYLEAYVENRKKKEKKDEVIENGRGEQRLIEAKAGVEK